MTWLSRKLASVCARQGCTAEPCADHCLCAKHRAEHNARQRRVAKARRAWQVRQVPLPHDDNRAWVASSRAEQGSMMNTANEERVMVELIPVERKDETPLCILSEWVIYRLMRQGKLPHVKVGRRRYLTAEGIAAFMASGGESSGGVVR